MADSPTVPDRQRSPFHRYMASTAGASMSASTTTWSNPMHLRVSSFELLDIGEDLSTDSCDYHDARSTAGLSDSFYSAAGGSLAGGSLAGGSLANSTPGSPTAANAPTYLWPSAASFPEPPCIATSAAPATSPAAVHVPFNMAAEQLQTVKGAAQLLDSTPGSPAACASPDTARADFPASDSQPSWDQAAKLVRLTPTKLKTKATGITTTAVNGVAVLDEAGLLLVPRQVQPDATLLAHRLQVYSVWRQAGQETPVAVEYASEAGRMYSSGGDAQYADDDGTADLLAPMSMVTAAPLGGLDGAAAAGSAAVFGIPTAPVAAGATPQATHSAAHDAAVKACATVRGAVQVMVAGYRGSAGGASVPGAEAAMLDQPIPAPSTALTSGGAGLLVHIPEADTEGQTEEGEGEGEGCLPTLEACPSPVLAAGQGSISIEASAAQDSVQTVGEEEVKETEGQQAAKGSSQLLPIAEEAHLQATAKEAAPELPASVLSSGSNEVAAPDQAGAPSHSMAFVQGSVCQLLLTHTVDHLFVSMSVADDAESLAASTPGPRAASAKSMLRDMAPAAVAPLVPAASANSFGAEASGSADPIDPIIPLGSNAVELSSESSPVKPQLPSSLTIARLTAGAAVADECKDLEVRTPMAEAAVPEVLESHGTGLRADAIAAAVTSSAATSDLNAAATVKTLSGTALAGAAASTAKALSGTASADAAAMAVPTGHADLAPQVAPSTKVVLADMPPAAAAAAEATPGDRRKAEFVVLAEGLVGVVDPFALTGDKATLAHAKSPSASLRQQGIELAVALLDGAQEPKGGHADADGVGKGTEEKGHEALARVEELLAPTTGQPQAAAPGSIPQVGEDASSKRKAAGLFKRWFKPCLCPTAKTWEV